MLCDHCGKKGLKINRISRSYGHGKDLLIIEGIPLMSCLHCGENYFTAETLYEIERIKKHRKAIAKRHVVEVAEFAL